MIGERLVVSYIGLIADLGVAEFYFLGSCLPNSHYS